MSGSKRNSQPIAVIGASAIFPAAVNRDEFWQNIVSGKDLITDVPSGHWLISDYYDPDPNATDKTYCKRGAFLPYIEFDPLEFGIPPSNIPVIDTAQLLSLVVAKQVLEDATDVRYLNMDLNRVSVILGAAALEALQYAAGRMQRPVWVKAMREAGLAESEVQTICDRISNSYVGWQENNFPGLLGNVVAGRIANRFNFGGTNCVVDAACAGSLAALSMAVNELQSHQADMVISGGVDTLNDIVMYMCFSKTKALSLANDCRPFSDKADGTIIGEGICMFALKRLEDAEKNGDHIYGVIKGIGSASDGRSKSIYAPLPQGQSKAIMRAYEAAGFEPETVGLIEAHGTATRAGDAAEFAGLNLAFANASAGKKPYCALGSVKSQIGHSKSAAGAAGLFKAVMALHHKILPPTIKVDKPNPDLNWQDSPFYLNTQTRPWIKNPVFPRRAGVSSFGFGGSNFHIALEEYTGSHQAKRIRANNTELFLLASENKTALIAACQTLMSQLDQQSFLHLAKQSQENDYRDLLARLSIVASDKEDLKQKLTAAITELQKNTAANLLLAKGVYYGNAQQPGRVAFLFPGQGSQYVNMGANLAMSDSDAMTLWDEASAQLNELDGASLSDVVFPIPVFSEAEKRQQEATLTQTQYAQPALAVTDLVYLSLLQKLEIQADVMAGHSFGELVALHAAGAMDKTTLLDIAKHRGAYMQQAASAEPSGMLSVAFNADAILEIIAKHQLTITPANFNSPKQLILSGALSELEKIKPLLDVQKISYKALPVATAFHSPLMKPASAAFKKYLKTLTFGTINLPVFANETAALYAQQESIPERLSDQLIKPVRFYETLQAMYQKGVRTFIEVGPKNVLTGLVNASFPAETVNAIALDLKNESGMTSIWHAIGKLFVIGLNPLCETLWQEYALPAAPKHAAHTLKINGTSYGKPYPPAAGVAALPSPNPERKEEPVMVTHLIKPKEASMSQSNHSLIQTYQELHRQLIEAHNTYQKMMADTHISFLQAINQISQHMAGGASTAIAMAPQQTFAPAVSMPSAPVMRQPAPVQVRQPAPAMQMAPQPIAIVERAAPKPVPMPVQEVIPQVVTTTPAPVTAPEVAVATAGLDIKELLLQVVAEKTGYPRAMLNMDMSIESDLGIDSIKRVEILSAFTEKVPNMPEINTAQLSQIQTLGDILSYAQGFDQDSSAKRAV